MLSNAILRRELIRSIMGNLGMIPKDEFGKHGIAISDFMVSKKLKVEYDGLPTEHINVYAAQMMDANNQILRATCCSLKEDLALVFGLSNGPLYGLRLDYYASVADEEWGTFLTKSANGWTAPKLYDQLLACAGIEMVTDLGTVWHKCSDYDDLYDELATIVEMS
jgi:hypothetical protein